MNNLDLKRKRIETLVKMLALAVIGFLVAPVIMVTIRGILGALAALAISFVAVNMTPWFAAVVANWRLKALKHEAAKNPIETLENDYAARVVALGQYRESIVNSKAAVENFHDKLGGFKKKFPQDAGKFDEQYAQMLALLKHKVAKYKEAVVSTDNYAAEITRAKAIWEMAQAAAEMNKAAGMDNDEVFARIQVETALDSVQQSLNSTFADLELSLAEEQAPTPETRVEAAMPMTEPAKALSAGARPLELDIELTEPASVLRKS